MAWHGDAQTEMLPIIKLYVIVKRFGAVAAEFSKDIDVNHIAAQIKVDILEDPERPIPPDMRKNPHECTLALFIDGKMHRLETYDRLLNYKDIVGSEARLELTDQMTAENLHNDETDMNLFGVHSRT